MTTNEKRNLLVNKALTRKEKNRYTQDVNKRTLIEKGYGDCSGTIWYWYKKLLGIDIGTNTEAQINSKKGTRINLTIKDGVPDESKMKKGDLLFFRGKDDTRTEGVGHVEMYIGNGQIFGHGSGIGGTVKNMRTYCLQRQKSTSTTKLKNRGLICVKRFIFDTVPEELTEANDIVWELKHRGIISDDKLWMSKSCDINIYWLLRKSVHYIRIKEYAYKIYSTRAVKLEKNADNVWELWHRNIVSNTTLWKSRGSSDINVYYLLQKLVYWMRKNGI